MRESPEVERQSTAVPLLDPKSRPTTGRSESAGATIDPPTSARSGRSLASRGARAPTRTRPESSQTAGPVPRRAPGSAIGTRSQKALPHLGVDGHVEEVDEEL